MNKFNPSDPKIQANIGKIKDLLSKENIHIFFVASPALIDAIVKDENPLVKGLPNSHKEILISGDGLKISSSLVLKWIDGTLDEKNKFILSNGDIRVEEDKSFVLFK